MMFMAKNLPLKLDREDLLQLSQSQLVDIVIEQALAIKELKKITIELELEVQRLKVSSSSDSKTSSKPPSGDILKKSEQKPEDNSSLTGETAKRKPGGQPGHPGKTRKGFGRVDRFEILRPQCCDCCGHAGFVWEPRKIETHQVAQLVERPIEIVEYHRHTCVCSGCGNPQTADWSADIVPGQDIGIKLQAFLGWVNNYDYSIFIVESTS
jgi:transposase